MAAGRRRGGARALDGPGSSQLTGLHARRARALGGRAGAVRWERTALCVESRQQRCRAEGRRPCRVAHGRNHATWSTRRRARRCHTLPHSCVWPSPASHHTKPLLYSPPPPLHHTLPHTSSHSLRPRPRTTVIIHMFITCACRGTQMCMCVGAQVDILVSNSTDAISCLASRFKHTRVRRHHVIRRPASSRAGLPPAHQLLQFDVMTPASPSRRCPTPPPLPAHHPSTILCPRCTLPAPLDQALPQVKTGVTANTARPASPVPISRQPRPASAYNAHTLLPPRAHITRKRRCPLPAHHPVPTLYSARTPLSTLPPPRPFRHLCACIMPTHPRVETLPTPCHLRPARACCTHAASWCASIYTASSTLALRPWTPPGRRG